jgi:hypothetical protein
MNEENTPQAVPAEEVPSSDAAFDTLLTEFSGVFGDEAKPPAPQAEEIKAEEAPAEVQPEVVEPPPVEEKEAQLSPLLAERARREKEARAELEQVRSSQEQAMAEFKKEFVAKMISNPQAFIQEHPELQEVVGDLALHFYAADLGEDAPDDLKKQVGMSDFERYQRSVEKRFEDLERQAIQREQVARDKATLDQYSGFLSEVPAELPYLAAEASHDAEEVLSTMAQVADHIYAQKGQYPSATEVASMIERELSATAARYAAIGKPTPNVKTPQTDQVEKPQPIKTLSTDHSGSSAKPSPVGEDELFEDALSYFEEMF